MRLRRRRASEELDAERSISVEEEGALEGYHFGLIGGLLKWGMTILGGLLLLSMQDAPEAALLILVFVVFYAFGWMMTREAGMQTFSSYKTVLDTLAYGATFGFLIRGVETVALVLTAGITDLYLTAPFEALGNSSLVDGALMILIALVFASVAEEMLHRGGMIFLTNLLDDKIDSRSEEKSSYSSYWALAIALPAQAFFFAVLHAAVYQHLEQFVALFCGGLVYGGLLIWKKDIGVCMIAHLTLNLSGYWPLLFEYLIANPVVGVLLAIGIAAIYLAKEWFGGRTNE